MIFSCLTADEVSKVHRFYSFLRKIGACGQLYTNTRQFSHSEFGKPIRYELTFSRYDRSMLGKLTADEQLSELLATKTRDAYIRPIE